MLTTLATQLIFKTDLTDPTGDGILTRVVQFGIRAMMVLVVLLGSWYAFKSWMDAKGKSDENGIKAIRGVVFGIIIIEAVLGGVYWLASYGTGLLGNLGIG